MSLQKYLTIKVWSNIVCVVNNTLVLVLNNWIMNAIQKPHTNFIYSKTVFSPEKSEGWLHECIVTQLYMCGCMYVCSLYYNIQVYNVCNIG